MVSAMQRAVGIFAVLSLCLVSASPLPGDEKTLNKFEKTVKPTQYVLQRLDLPTSLTPDKKLAIVAELLRRRRSEVQSAESKESMSTAAHQIMRALDISKLTPEQKRILAMRIGLLRRRRSVETDKNQNKEQSNLEDLDGADTYGFGAAALPFLGLYGLGLGGLGVGLGPLAFAGLFG